MKKKLILFFLLISIVYGCCNNITDCRLEYNKALFEKNYSLVNCTGTKLYKLYNCDYFLTNGSVLSDYYSVCKDILGAIGYSLENLNSSQAKKYLESAGYYEFSEKKLIKKYQSKEISKKYEKSNFRLMEIIILLMILIISLYLLIEGRYK